MGDWSLKGRAGGSYRAIPYTSIATVGTNTKSGAWIELTSATESDGYLSFMIFGAELASDILIDIAIGAAGSEVIIVNNLKCSIVSTTQIRDVTSYDIPILIPAGTRVSAKVQSTANANDVVIIASLVRYFMLGSDAQLALCTTFGADTSDSGGTSIDPGDTINTDGAWVELSSSVPFDIKALIVAFGGQTNTFRSTCTWGVDVGVGSAGNEVAILDHITITTHVNNDTIRPNTLNLVEVSIPKGSRLSVRAQCTINDATDRLFDVIIYAFS